jgi:hypothetical protein
MTMIQYPHISGHAPGHFRETFLSAVDAFIDWKPGESEPTVEIEVGYVPHPITITKACKLLWHCTDIMPGSEFYQLRDDAGLEMRSRTYAACARAMLTAIRANEVM